MRCTLQIMCGITGIISINNYLVSKERIVKMMNAVAHRGPDGEGYWINPNESAGLGHRRLSIIDLSEAAAQPMHFYPGNNFPGDNSSPRYTITYNGEVYNYPEIKSILYNIGYRFHSHSDTEVILAAYDHWKEDCLQYFDGMFSFAIWDHKEKTLFAARDRFGEKPFYYYSDNEQFIFGSEMKAIWAAGIKKSIDEKMLLNYLALGYVQSANDKGQTFFNGIYSLPPAHYLKLHSSDLGFHIRSYWSINKDLKTDISSKDAIDKFTSLFSTSIKRRLRSDVTVGSSLSGGLDSASIAATICRLQKRRNSRQPYRLQTFSALFPGFKKNEAVNIQFLTNRLHLKNYQTFPNADNLIKQFETLCYHQEEPFPSSSIYAQYEVYALAKKQGVKVLLDGQGADEILAGYTKYIQWYLQQMVARGKLYNAFTEHSSLRKNKVAFNWGVGNLLAAYLPTHAALYLEKNEFRKINRQPDLNKDFIASLNGREWEGIHKPIITKLNDILYFNTAQMGLEELLRFADRNSMAHGREVRLPFLSHELVEFIFSLAAGFKIHNGYTKWILRKAMEKNLPAELLWRTEKIGFETPQHSWMQHASLQEYMQEAKRKLVKKGILKSSALNKNIHPQAANEADNFNWRYLSAAQIL